MKIIDITLESTCIVSRCVNNYQYEYSGGIIVIVNISRIKFLLYLLDYVFFRKF
jgi:hypothetical protein